MKGFYRGFTVELDLSILAVNTILQSEYLKDFEEASVLATQYQNDGKDVSGFTKV